MKFLLLAFLLMGCGLPKSLIPDELPTPGHTISPIPAVRYDAVKEHTGLYSVVVQCNAWFDANTFEISEEIDEQCSAQDFEGEAGFFFTRGMFLEWKKYRLENAD